MLRHYLLIAFRNMVRSKVNAFIHIAGLAIGIASVILIVLFIQDELNYDKFLKNSPRIFQVTVNGSFGNEEFWAGNTAPPVGAALASSIPEIETYCRTYEPEDAVIRSTGNNSEKFFTEKNITAVDSNFLQVFDFELLQGDPKTALFSPNSIVLTESMAKKYFDSKEALGKTLHLYESRTPYLVTGVLKDIPDQSSIRFDFLLPISSYPVVKQFTWSWVWLQVNNYVMVRKDVNTERENLKRIESRFPDVVKTHAAGAFQRIGQPLDELKKKGGKWDLHLLPFTDVHLRSGNISMRWLHNISNIRYVYIFGAIAIVIIVLACVNFMNLSTAQAAKRAKEVGVRKVAGAVKAYLIRQFLVEAFLYSAVAAVLGMVLVTLFLGPFNQITGKHITPLIFLTENIWIYVIALSLVTTFLAGSYPAFYLTAFKPVRVLKGELFRNAGRHNVIRNGLVVFQFAVSTILIICTVVVYEQLRFFQNKNLGLKKENRLIINNTRLLGESERTFRETLAQLSGISAASVTTSIPTESSFGDGYQTLSDDDIPNKEIGLSSYMTDEHFVPALDIEIVQGRNFFSGLSDSASVILNEEAVMEIGWKDPIGKRLLYPGSNSGNQQFEVIGVARNFNTESLQQAVTPFALFHYSSATYGLPRSYIVANVEPGNMFETINQVREQWKKFAPDKPFDFHFLDSAFDALYRSEKRMGTVFSVFTCLSIFIACLGLFGLSSYTAERRVKEIGIRKILGASVHSLLALLSKDFIKLVLIAAVIAFPIASYAMHRWLEDFAHRIEIRWWMFGVALFASIMIAIVTVSVQALRAALTNPVKSLRTE